MTLRPQRIVFLVLFLIPVILSGVAYLSGNDDEAEVHKKVLKGLSGKLPIAEFSFYSHPSSCRGAKLASLPAVPEELFKNFKQKNNVLLGKPRQIKIDDRQYHIVNKEDSHFIYTGKPPRLKGIPKRLINISRVGFNSSKTQALVCVESEESGDLVFLQKDNSGWQVAKWAYIW